MLLSYSWGLLRSQFVAVVVVAESQFLLRSAVRFLLGFVVRSTEHREDFAWREDHGCQAPEHFEINLR